VVIINILVFILLLSALTVVFIRPFGQKKNITVEVPLSDNTPLADSEEDNTPEKEPMVPALVSDSQEYILFDFEKDAEGWGIPAWALNMRDHVAESIEQTSKFSSSGNGSLKIRADFPKKQWSAAVVEIQNFLNLKNFDMISADIYFPSNRSKVLRGKFILTVGDDWGFSEMSRTFRIEPGKWTTISANISEKSIDWKNKKIPDDSFKSDIRKVAIRIESTKDRYSGPIYIDNIRVSRKPL